RTCNETRVAQPWGCATRYSISPLEGTTSMRLLTLENWPVLVICAGMLAAAIIDWWKFKVPNKLTFPLIISGWLLGLANDLGLNAGEGGIGAAFAGTMLGFFLLLPIYSVGGMGAGDVKMTMGFGSWICAFYGTNEG